MPGIAFLALSIIILVETFLSAGWNRFYFNFGIPLIVKIVQVDIHHKNIPGRALLEKKFKSDWFIFTRSMYFKKIDKNIYGFRTSLFPIKQMSLMHGKLKFDHETGKVVVKGFFDWAPVCFLLIWTSGYFLKWMLEHKSFYAPNRFAALGYFGFLLFIFGFIYLLDFLTFSAIAEFSAQAWTRKYRKINGVNKSNLYIYRKEWKINHFESISDLHFGTYSMEMIRNVIKEALSVRTNVRVKRIEDINTFLLDCKYKSDQELFNQSDYWQTPGQFEVIKAGDCEDFAIWAWVKLLELGLTARLTIGIEENTGHAWVTLFQNGQVYIYETIMKLDRGKLPIFLVSEHESYKPIFSIDNKLDFYQHR